MTGEECVRLHENMALRRYIIERARARTRRVEDWEELIADAWAAVWQKGLAGQTDEHYQEIALRGIRAGYMRQYRRRKKYQLAKRALTKCGTVR